MMKTITNPIGQIYDEIERKDYGNPVLNRIMNGEPLPEGKTWGETLYENMAETIANQKPEQNTDQDITYNLGIDGEEVAVGPETEIPIAPRTEIEDVPFETATARNQRLLGMKPGDYLNQ